MKITTPIKDVEERNRSHLGGLDCLLLELDISQRTCSHRHFTCQSCRNVNPVTKFRFFDHLHLQIQMPEEMVAGDSIFHSYRLGAQHDVSYYTGRRK